MSTDITKQMTEQMTKQAEVFNKQMAEWAKAAHTAGSKALSDMVSQASGQPNVDEKPANLGGRVLRICHSRV